MIESKRFGKINSEGETKFEQLSGTLDIDKGIVHNKDMLMTATGFKLTGQGVLANLNNETINYDMAVNVDETKTTRNEKSYNIGGYEIPVKCRGPLSKPDCKPDVGDIAKVLLQKGGEEKLKGLLEKTLGLESAAPAVTAPAETTVEQPVTQEQQTAQEPTATTEQTTTKKKKKKADPVEEGLKALEGLFD
jgi:hypothetical protein